MWPETLTVIQPNLETGVQKISILPRRCGKRITELYAAIEKTVLHSAGRGHDRALAGILDQPRDSHSHDLGLSATTFLVIPVTTCVNRRSQHMLYSSDNSYSTAKFKFSSCIALHLSPKQDRKRRATTRATNIMTLCCVITRDIVQ